MSFVFGNGGRSALSQRPVVGRATVLALALIIVLGCSSASQVPEPTAAPAESPDPVVVALPEHFSGEIAGAHLAALIGLGSRSPGSETDLGARRYLVEGFQAVGAQVRSVADGRRRHLVAEIPGESEDVLLLVAPYPVLENDLWIGDSGAALLLELARVASLTQPPYTLEFALAETRDLDVVRVDAIGEGSTGASAADGASEAVATAVAFAPIEDGPLLARQRVVFAGESLARSLAVNGDFERLRGVVVFDGASRNGLRIARDLGSHAVFREVFWDSAAFLDYEATFPRDAGWAAPRSLQIGFEELSMDRVLTLADETRARPELASIPARGEESNEALEAVGRVSIEALERLMHRLSRIDSFARGDTGVPANEPEPEPAPAPRAGGAAPAASEQASPQIPESSPSS